MKRKNWMGRYRSLINELVKYENSYARIASSRRLQMDDIFMSSMEWQVLEYIIVHEDEDSYMLTISDDLGIAPSSLSKQVKSLLNNDLIERFHTTTDKKKVIIKATAKGKEIYSKNVDALMEPLFDVLFHDLDSIPDKYIEQFTKALTNYNNVRQHHSSNELVKIP
ncbi:MAG: MarR family winged helix-turn-helix transcriptional regulator [Lachnospiraceae bacterium]|nr:MarR family winged helix-turn-helix transcriptional regulator [Lachnospiraceae bacterium]